ncbi:outer membrane beta-barrel protein [Bartonella jaculi]|uniref:Outer membrane protein beta-barrel domain-containing protein n=1 Tax=Bartonella jaculi TaxID=686226 RepID=A0ABP9MZY8_9HYPH
MNTKRLISASIFALISASAAQAADVMIPHQPARAVQPAIVVPAFTWAGFYLGGQIGGFSGKTDMSVVGKDKNIPLSKDWSPKLSGFEGGLYTGANIDLGDNFIFSIDTDFSWAGQKHTKTITIGAPENTAVDSLVSRSRRSTETVSAKQTSVTQVSAKPDSTASSSTNPAGSAPTSSEGSVQTKQTESAPTKPAAEAGVNAGGNTQRSSTVPSSPTSTTSTPKASASTKLTGIAQTKPATSGGADAAVVLQSLTPQTSSVGRSASSGARSVSLTSNSVKKVGDSGKKAEAVTSGAGKAQSGETRQRVLMSSSSQATQSTATPASVASKVEATVPKQPLVLARSGSFGSEENTASDGGKHAQGHGASHGSGHGSGADPHGKGIHHPHSSNPHAASSRGSNPHGTQNVAGRSAQGTQAADESGTSAYGIEQVKKEIAGLGLNQEGNVETLSHTFKQNWGGATRVRIGFAADRFMPYVAGGIAYGQFQDTISITLKQGGEAASSKNLTDETKTMVGYTLGGGVDFAMTDNILLRAEYRYSDFGKKKFAKEKLEIDYKINDFRVGVAYKF